MSRRFLDGVALGMAVLLSLLLVSAAGVYTGTDAEIVPAPVLSSERPAPESPPDASREKTLALLILLLKEGRGTR